MEEEQKIRVGITQGDVNGVGLEIIMKALAEQEMYEGFIPIIYGSPKAAAYHRKNISLQNFSLNNIREASEAHPKRVNIITCGDDNIHVEIGKPSQFAGEAALESLKAAVEDLKKGAIDVLVLAPTSDAMMRTDSNNFTSQQDYIAQQFGVDKCLSLLVSDSMRIGIATGNSDFEHISKHISIENLQGKIQMLNKALQTDFTIRRPRIAVLSLNPTAVNESTLGKEEKNIILPAIESTQAEGICAMGPYTADTIFGNGMAFKFDAILALYHDQGATPFNAMSFENRAMYIAGLPAIVTSPIQGPDYEIAGQDKAVSEPLRAAIYLAIDTFRNRKLNADLVSNPMQTRANNETERNA